MVPTVYWALKLHFSTGYTVSDKGFFFSTEVITSSPKFFFLCYMLTFYNTVLVFLNAARQAGNPTVMTVCMEKEM